MQKKPSITAAAGVAAVAMAAGTAAYLMNTKASSSQRRRIKKTAGQAAKALGGMVNGMVDSVASSLLG